MRVKRAVNIVLIGVFLYILIYSVMLFYNGYHNLDLSFNFLNLGYTMDKGIDKHFISLEVSYLAGLNQMRSAFAWIGFDIILAFYVGYVIKLD